MNLEMNKRQYNMSIMSLLYRGFQNGFGRLRVYGTRPCGTHLPCLLGIFRDFDRQLHARRMPSELRTRTRALTVPTSVLSARQQEPREKAVWGERSRCRDMQKNQILYMYISMVVVEFIMSCGPESHHSAQSEWSHHVALNWPSTR